MPTENNCSSFLCDYDVGSDNDDNNSDHNNDDNDNYYFVVVLVFFLAFTILPNLIVYITYLHKHRQISAAMADNIQFTFILFIAIAVMVGGSVAVLVHSTFTSSAGFGVIMAAFPLILSVLFWNWLYKRQLNSNVASYSQTLERNPSLDAPPTYEEVSIFTVENGNKNKNNDCEKLPTYDEATITENGQTERF